MLLSGKGLVIESAEAERPRSVAEGERRDPQYAEQAIARAKARARNRTIRRKRMAEARVAQQ